MKITIWWTEQDGGGYMYNIWMNEEVDDNDDCDDGGLYLGTYDDAIQFVCEHARDMVREEG